MKITIYKFTNLINGKIYVGSTKNIIKRKQEHLSPYIQKRVAASYLYKAFNKYGVESFMFDIIEECCPLLRSQYENKWITYYNTLDRRCGYNIIPADNPGYAWVGRKHTEESKKRMSNSLKGRVSWNAGIFHTEEHKNNLSKAHETRAKYAKGFKVSDETKLKQSIAKLGKVAKNKGISPSEESKKKMSEGWVTRRNRLMPNTAELAILLSQL